MIIDTSSPFSLTPPDIDLGSPTYQHELDEAVAQEERLQISMEHESVSDTVISSVNSETSTARMIERGQYHVIYEMSRVQVSCHGSIGITIIMIAPSLISCIIPQSSHAQFF